MDRIRFDHGNPYGYRGRRTLNDDLACSDSEVVLPQQRRRWIDTGQSLRLTQPTIDDGDVHQIEHRETHQLMPYPSRVPCNPVSEPLPYPRVPYPGFPRKDEASTASEAVEERTSVAPHAYFNKRTRKPQEPPLHLGTLNKFFIRVFNDIQVYLKLEESNTADIHYLVREKDKIDTALELLRHILDEHGLDGDPKSDPNGEAHVRLRMLCDLWGRISNRDSPVDGEKGSTFSIPPNFLCPPIGFQALEADRSPAEWSLASVDRGSPLQPALKKPTISLENSPLGISENSQGSDKPRSSTKRVTINVPEKDPRDAFSSWKDFTSALEKQFTRLIHGGKRLPRRKKSWSGLLSLFQNSGGKKAKALEYDEEFTSPGNDNSPGLFSSSQRSAFSSTTLSGISSFSAELKHFFGIDQSPERDEVESTRAYCHQEAREDMHARNGAQQLVTVSQGRVKGGAKYVESHARAREHQRRRDSDSYVPSSMVSSHNRSEAQPAALPRVAAQDDMPSGASSASTRKPTPDSTATSSYRISERIINEGPFGSPGELPTTHGGVLDPANMPPQKSELLPSLSLACSEGRSPHKRRKSNSTRRKSKPFPQQQPHAAPAGLKIIKPNPLPHIGFKREVHAALKKAVGTSPSLPPVVTNDAIIQETIRRNAAVATSSSNHPGANRVITTRRRISDPKATASSS